MPSIAENRLRQANLRATRHRICVLTALMDAGKPMSHPEILQQLRDIKLDRVTLYRILTSLTDASIVHQVQGMDGIWRFCAHDEDTAACPGGHPHLLCESCGTMLCLTGQKLPHCEVPPDFHVTHKQMVISGICSKCQEMRDSNES